MSLSRAYTRASYVFSFSSITSITIYVNYHADKELDSDRRRDRRVIVVIEERFFNVKICDFSHKFTIKLWIFIIIWLTVCNRLLWRFHAPNGLWTRVNAFRSIYIEIRRDVSRIRYETDSPRSLRFFFYGLYGCTKSVASVCFLIWVSILLYQNLFLPAYLTNIGDAATRGMQSLHGHGESPYLL